MMKVSAAPNRGWVGVAAMPRPRAAARIVSTARSRRGRSGGAGGGSGRVAGAREGAGREWVVGKRTVVGCNTLHESSKPVETLEVSMVVQGVWGGTVQGVSGAGGGRSATPAGSPH